MKKHEAEKLIETIRSLMEEQPAPSHQSGRKGTPKWTPTDPLPTDEALKLDIGKARTMEGTSQAGEVISRFDEPALEKLYQSFKARLLEELPVDPVMLHLLTVRPEIIVDVEKRVIGLDGSSADMKARLARLIAAGFFATARRAGAISAELKKTGTEPAGNRLTEGLDWMKKAGFLVLNDRDWIAAPGVKVTERTIESRE